MNVEKNINPPSVLIVDDNVKNLQVLGGFLQKEGMLVEFALDGMSALNWLEKKKFDLILLDIMMPGIDGYFDQFGGPETKKFMRKRFMELLYKNYQLPLPMQKEALSETHIQWKGNIEQTDDIVVMGIRF